MNHQPNWLKLWISIALIIVEWSNIVSPRCFMRLGYPWYSLRNRNNMEKRRKKEKKNKKKNILEHKHLNIHRTATPSRRVIIPVIVGADRFGAKTSLNNNRASSELVRGNNPRAFSRDVYRYIQTSRLMSIESKRTSPQSNNNLGYSQSGDVRQRPRTTGWIQDGGSAMREAVRRKVHNLIRNVVYEATRELCGSRLLTIEI